MTLFKPEKNHLFEVLERIKNVVPNLYQIHIQGIAEPFYQTRENGFLFFEVLDALDFDAHSEKITISLKRVPHSITNFSIDASTPETFKSIRIMDCFDKVLENMYAFNKERVRPRQFLRIHNNINIMNVNEVVGMVHIAKKADAEYVEFNPTNGFNYKIFVNEQNCGLFSKAQQDIIDECKKLNQPYNFIRDLDLGMTERLVQITM